MCEEITYDAETFILDKFEFENGKILEDVLVEYTTFGEPKYDSEGKMNNVVVYCHGSAGNYNSVKKIHPLTEDIFTEDKYFFISFSALGTPNSCSPSTTGLKHDFPEYTIKDIVNFKRKFLKEKFGIEKIHGVIGNSLGGYMALTWAANYPEEVEFVISLVSGFKTAGANYASSKIVQRIIESDPNYLTGEDDESLKRTLQMAALMEFPLGFSRDYYAERDNEELDLSISDYCEEVILDNIYDIKFRNDAGLLYNIEDKLKNITAKVLIIAINEDRYFPPKFDAIPMSKLIKNSKLVIYDSKLGHIGSVEIKKIEKEFKEFLNSL